MMNIGTVDNGWEYGALIKSTPNNIMKGGELIYVDYITNQMSDAVWIDEYVDVGNNEKVIARAHTHPSGFAPSWKDFYQLGDYLMEHRNYKISFIDAGDIRYAIEIADYKEAQKVDRDELFGYSEERYKHYRSKGLSKKESRYHAACDIANKYTDAYNFYISIDSKKQDFIQLDKDE